MILYNDEVAGFYMDFLKERGLRVPEDLSLVSFDDAGPEQNAELKILSAIHPKYNLGRNHSPESAPYDGGSGLGRKRTTRTSFQFHLTMETRFVI